MVTKNQVREQLRLHERTLSEMGVRSLALFGSVSKDRAGPASDVDLLVEFVHPVGLFEFVRLKNCLEDMLGCEVDLVTPDALRESMKPEILREAVRVTPALDAAD